MENDAGLGSRDRKKEGSSMRPKSVVNVLSVCLGAMLMVFAIAGTSLAGITRVPEIDAGTLGGGLALLVGGYLVVVSRFRRK